MFRTKVVENIQTHFTFNKFCFSKIVLFYGLRVLVGKSEGKRPLGRPRRRWEDNIKMDLQKVGGGCGGWIGSG